MEIPFYMYTENEVEQKQTLMDTLNALNHKYPQWTYTTTEMLQLPTQNMAKTFVYLLEHTMTQIASIDVDTDEGVLFQLRDHQPTSPAEWLEALKSVEGARFENGVNGQLLDADQLYQIVMALNSDQKPTRHVKMKKFQGNFYRTSPMPESAYQQAKAAVENSSITKMQLTSFEGDTVNLAAQYPHTYLLTPKGELDAIKDIKKTLQALPFVHWPKQAGGIEETVILQQFVKYYRAMVLHFATARRPLVYVHDVDDTIPTLDAVANENNVVEDWTDGFTVVNNKDAFNKVMNAALVPGKWVKEGKHKAAVKTYQNDNDDMSHRYLYTFVDQNAVKRGQIDTPNAVLEVDVISEVEPILADNGQVLHKADMLSAKDYQEYVKSHRPTASKKHRNNRKK